MCGIAGVISKKTHFNEKIIDMLNIMTHRGPDDISVYNHNNVSLGHLRLEIRGGAHGKQPFFSYDKKVVCIYNGEIYNHIDLEVEFPDYGFSGTSDGEVIIPLYLKYGEEFVKKLNGDFAICIYDCRNNILLLFRDRAGVKPLYFYNDAYRFVFSSEIKGILALEDIDIKLKKKAISEYLVTLFPHYPECFFKDIFSVKPGYILSYNINNGDIKYKCYWDITKVGNRDISFEDAKFKFRAIFEDSIRIRLRSERRLGAFLSGGLDSTAIALLSEKITDFYTVDFLDYPFYSEVNLAKDIAKKTGGVHNKVVIGPDDIVKNFKKVVFHEEAPPSGAGAHFIYLLTNVASSDGIRVMLDGNGGDECLAGYPRYRLMKYKKHIGFDNKKYIEKLRNLNPLAKGDIELNVSDEEYYLRIFHMFSPLEFGIYLNYNNFNFKNPFIFSKGKTLLKSMMICDFKNYLCSLLETQDKMTMANSIEDRVPFLDYRLIEFCFSIPDEYLMNSERGKILIREALFDVYPDEILNHKKVGTPRPDAEWFRNSVLGDFMMDTLGNKEHILYDYLNYDAVLDIVNRHRSGKFNFSQRIWVFLNLAIFLEVYKRWIL